MSEMMISVVVVVIGLIIWYIHMCRVRPDEDDTITDEENQLDATVVQQADVRGQPLGPPQAPPANNAVQVQPGYWDHSGRWVPPQGVAAQHPHSVPGASGVQVANQPPPPPPPPPPTYPTGGGFIVKQRWPDSAIWANIGAAPEGYQACNIISFNTRWSVFLIDGPPHNPVPAIPDLFESFECKLKMKDGNLHGVVPTSMVHADDRTILGHYNDDKGKMAFDMSYGRQFPNITFRVQVQGSATENVDGLLRGKYRLFAKPVEWEGNLVMFPITDGDDGPALRTLSKRRGGSSPVYAVGDSECMVCLDAEIDCCLKPCGHISVCHECAQSLDKKICPICRAVINQVIMLA